MTEQQYDVLIRLIKAIIRNESAGSDLYDSLHLDEVDREAREVLITKP